MSHLYLISNIKIFKIFNYSYCQDFWNFFIFILVCFYFVYIYFCFLCLRALSGYICLYVRDWCSNIFYTGPDIKYARFFSPHGVYLTTYTQLCIVKAVKNICKKMGVDGFQKNPLLTKQITGAILENSFVVPQNVKHTVIIWCRDSNSRYIYSRKLQHMPTQKLVDEGS